MVGLVWTKDSQVADIQYDKTVLVCALKRSLNTSLCQAQKAYHVYSTYPIRSFYILFLPDTTATLTRTTHKPELAGSCADDLKTRTPTSSSLRHSLKAADERRTTFTEQGNNIHSFVKLQGMRINNLRQLMRSQPSPLLPSPSPYHSAYH